MVARFSGLLEAEACIMNKIANGSSRAGVCIEMPDDPDMSKADRKILEKLMLSLK